MKPREHMAGTTLVELIVSIVILSVAVTGILMVITRTSLSSADPMMREQATAIAQSYMEEILTQPLADPDGTSGETDRALFDDIWDYNGLNDSGGALDQGGNPISGLEGYNISVQLSSTGVTLGGSPATRIRVLVTHDGHGGVNLPLTAYRLN